MDSEREKHGLLGAARGWIVLIVLCSAIVAWGLVAYFTIRDRPRAWDFGVLPDAPGESVYSTQKAPDQLGASTQVAPLPEARPKERTQP
jgi:hypothetical protein